MKENSHFEIICLVVALVGMIMKTVADEAMLKQIGGLALYGLSTIAVISKVYRFRQLPANTGQKLTMGAGVILLLAAVLGEIFDPGKMYNALWFLGMIATGVTTNNLYKAQKDTVE